MRRRVQFPARCLHCGRLPDVPVPRPRSVDDLISPEFLATKARLEALIHPPEIKNDEDEVVTPRMIRFVNVADNVE